MKEKSKPLTSWSCNWKEFYLISHIQEFVCLLPKIRIALSVYWCQLVSITAIIVVIVMHILDSPELAVLPLLVYSFFLLSFSLHSFSFCHVVLSYPFNSRILMRPDPFWLHCLSLLFCCTYAWRSPFYLARKQITTIGTQYFQHFMIFSLSFWYQNWPILMQGHSSAMLIEFLSAGGIWSAYYFQHFLLSQISSNCVLLLPALVKLTL